MKYTRLGDTGLKISRLCLGTMTFGFKFRNIGAVGQDDADIMVKKAYEAGINFFDTADMYSFGQSEEILGNALKKLKVPREKFVVATKVRSPLSEEAMKGTGDVNNSGLSRKHIIEACNNSLKRLKVDYIDLYQVHGWDTSCGLEETLEALNDLVRQGKVLYLGVSNWTARHIMKAIYLAKAKNFSRFVSLQAYYSLAARDLEHELIQLCREEGLGILPWSPLSGGFLTGKYTRQNPKPAGARRSEFNFPPVDERGYDAIDILTEISKNTNISIPKLSLAWLLFQKGITSVIIGANKISQLEDNLESVNVNLTNEEILKLSSVTMPKKLYPQWMVEWQNERTSLNPDEF
jgi:aryl-alcohol dehydrogenase-like predicted oxidoreductase